MIFISKRKVSQHVEKSRSPEPLSMKNTKIGLETPARVRPCKDDIQHYNYLYSV